jgi:intein/homing endonuclease
VDYDKCLVEAILREGKPGLKAALDQGVRAEVMFGDGAKCFDFILTYTKTKGEMPSFKVVCDQVQVALQDDADGGKASHWAEKIINRRLSNSLQEGLMEVEALVDAKPREAVEVLGNMMLKLRKEKLAGTLIESLPALGKEVWDYYQKIKNGDHGILAPWQTINDATLGFWPEDLCLFVARLGIGKCIHEDSEIVDPETGVVRTIRQVVEGSQSKVWTWSEQKGLHSAPITAKVDTGRKTCFRFTFASGRSIVVTPEHPLLTAEGWKRADQFKVGMTAALPARVPAPERPVGLPSETVFTLALLLAEGSYTGHHVGFSTADEKILDGAREAAEAFGVEVKHRSNYDYDFVTTGREHPVRRLLQKHGIDKTLAKNKIIPESVFRLSLLQLSEFLSTFWMCDGYVDGTGPGVTLASEKMVRQLQHLLLRFGIQSSVDYKKATCDGKEFDAWRLRVYAFSWEAFVGAVPLWGHKREKFEELLALERNPNVGFPRVSDQFIAQVKELAATKAGRWNEGGLKKVGDLLGWRTYFGVRNLFGKNNSLLLRRFEAFCAVYGLTERFKWLWSADVFWDEVERIEDVGEQKIYDLTVAPTSCFVANDIIVHNTWTSIMLAGCAWEQTIKNPDGSSRPCRVLYATTEMAKARIALRWYAIKLKLPYGQLRRGQLGVFLEKKLEEGIAEFVGSPNFNIVGGDFDFSMESFDAAIDEANPDIVVLDGAYLLKVPGLTRQERAANAFDELKRINKRRKVPIIVTMQFNREVKTNQAKTVAAESIALTDVAGWNADLIYGLIQTDEMKKNKRLMLKPLKIREGESDEIECNWNFDSMDFSELPKAMGSGTGGGGAPQSDAADPSGGAPDPFSSGSDDVPF